MLTHAAVTGFLTDALANLILPPLTFAGGFKVVYRHSPAYFAGMLFTMRFFWAIAIYYAISVSAAKGIRLMVITFLAIFGLSSIMTQIETIVFLKSFPAFSLQTVGQIALASFISGIFFTPVAVYIAGRKKQESISIIWPETLVIRILALSLIYPAIYFSLVTLLRTGLMP